MHSFVDLITNSSSELFVCDTDKSIELTKEIVNDLLVKYYTDNISHLANEISYSNYKYFFKYFNLKLIPIKKYDYTPIINFIKEHLSNLNKEQLEKFIIDFAESDIFKVEVANFDCNTNGFLPCKEDVKFLKCYHSYGYTVNTIRTTLKRCGMEEYHKAKRNSKFVKIRNKKYNSLCLKLMQKKNGRAALDTLRSIEDEKKEFILKKYNLEEPTEEMDYLVSYGIDVKRGDILIWSLHDNSIPYDIWDDINNIFNGVNYHLG